MFKIVSGAMITISALLISYCCSAGIIDSIEGTIDSASHIVNSSIDLTKEISGTNKETTNSSSQNEEFQKSYKLLHQIVEEYSNNSVAAAKKWENKNVTLTVMYDHIQDGDVYCQSGSVESGGYYVTFKIPDYNTISSLRKSDYITITGTLDRYIQPPLPITLNNAKMES